MQAIARTEPTKMYAYVLMGRGPVHVQARVEAAGGQILFWNGVRVMGVLAVSRAIGDHCLRPYVIADPEVILQPLA